MQQRINLLLYVISLAALMVAACAPPAPSADPGDGSLAPVVDAMLPGAIVIDDSPVPGVSQVSPSGNDSTGNGSLARPWRTIGYALNHLDATQGTPVLNLAAGTYDERISINTSVDIRGAGSNTVIIRNSDPADTDFVITTGATLAAGTPAITVSFSGLQIDGVNGKNGGLHAIQTALTLADVNVHNAGGYNVVIAASSPDFSIQNCTIGSIGFIYSDIGIDVGSGTSGNITNCTLADRIDHAINIGVGCHVTISGCHISGSPIYWADGIRVQGAANVSITNTTIIRPPGSEAASAGAMHNPPYAGIEIAASSNAGALVSVSNCTISGFDVGIGLNMMWNSVLIQQCTLGGNLTADLQTIWHGSSSSMYPVIDLGGGALGSTGGNNFGSGVEVAVQMGGPYDVSALNNQWGVIPLLIDGRITDHMDDSLLGHVLY